MTVARKLLALLVLVGALPAVAAAGEAIDANTISKANNPLADMNAFNFHNFFSPSLYGVPNATANTLNLRGIMVTGRHVIRATLPVSTAPTSPLESVSGLGNLNIFDAILVTGPSAATMVGIGPLLVMPTATEDPLGAKDTWQAGAAAIVVKPMEGGNMIGTLLTWQTDFAGGDDRVDTNLMTGQIFLTMPVGGGWYLRSTPLWVFDFENESYLVPIGLGAGRVLRFGSAVVNAFIEPQVTVYHEGVGLPSLQVFTGLNFQFPKAP